MKRYKLLNAEIDFSRGEISIDGQTKTLEPKVMAVLALLIQAEGEVVSQEKIFESVWPGSIYSQSLIQRSIAMLRKALGDDAKQQSYIVTHPKRGYSLAPKASELTNAKPLLGAYTKTLNILIPLICLLALGSYWLANTNSKTSNNEISEVKWISASDANESNPQKLRSGYTSFVRHTDGKGEAIWLYNNQSEQEVRISDYYSNIVHYQWLDESVLLFGTFAENTFHLYKTTQIDSNNSLQDVSAVTSELTNISQLSRVDSFYLTNTNQLIYLAKIDDKNTLLSLNLVTEQTQILLQEELTFKPYTFSVNSLENKLAIAGFNEKLATNIVLLDLPTSLPVTKQILAQLDSNIYQVSWQKDANQLLITDGRQLILIDEQGTESVLPYHTSSFIKEATFSQDNQSILLTELDIDADLWLDADNGQTAELVVNSTGTDYAGSFSHDGKFIAFISTRKGYPQIYLKNLHNGNTEVLFNNPERKLLLSPPIWHHNKNKIATTVNEELLIIDLTQIPTQQTRYAELAVSPYAWYTKQNAMLVVDYANNKAMLSKLELDSGLLIPIEKNAKNGALLSPKNKLYLIEQSDIYTLEDNKPVIKAQFNGLIIAAIASKQGIYVQTQEEDQQYLYLLPWQGKNIERIKALPSQVYVIWSIHPTSQQLLFETTSANQDIVELSLQ